MTFKKVGPRIYDSRDETVQFIQKPIQFGETYWGYAMPQRILSDEKKVIICSIGSHWTEEKCWKLHTYLDFVKPAMRRCLRVGGGEKHYADLRGKKVPGYSQASADKMQLECDNFLAVIRVPPEEENSVTINRLCSPGSSWALLDMVLRGIIPAPEAYIRPPIIDDVIEGKVAFK